MLTKKLQNFILPKWAMTKNELVQTLEPVPNYQGGAKVPSRLACQMLFLKNIGSTSPPWGLCLWVYGGVELPRFH